MTYKRTHISCWLVFIGLLVFSFLVAHTFRQTSADELYTRIVTEKITYMVANDYDRTSPISPRDLAAWPIGMAAFEEDMPGVMQIVVRNPDPDGSPLLPRLIVKVAWLPEYGLVALVVAYDYVAGDTPYRYMLDYDKHLFEPVKPVEPVNPGGHPAPEKETEIRRGSLGRLPKVGW